MIIALSYGATFISTSAIIGFDGMAANMGMGLIWLTVLNIGLGILVTFVMFGKKAREIGQAFFGKVTLLGSSCTAVDPIVIALPISMVVMIFMQWQSGKQQVTAVVA